MVLLLQLICSGPVDRPVLVSGAVLIVMTLRVVWQIGDGLALVVGVGHDGRLVLV